MPVPDAHVDAVDHGLCQMKSARNLMCWLDACGESKACVDDSLVAQHRLLSDV